MRISWELQQVANPITKDGIIATETRCADEHTSLDGIPSSRPAHNCLLWLEFKYFIWVVLALLQSCLSIFPHSY